MKPQPSIEIQIPFAGFYYSLHDDQLTREIEDLADHYAESTGHDIPEKLMEMFWDAANFGNARLEYSKAYAEAFCDEYLPGATFAAMTSPREYNFETDRIFVQITRDHIAKLWRGADRDTLTRIARDRHTSQDGFISYYSPDWRSWGYPSSWDHNQLMTLLLAYLETERGEKWDQWAEYSLCEDLSGNGYISNWLWEGEKANRAWRLFNYLTYDRPRHKAKNMAEWRRVSMKPFETTPLGAYAS